MPHTVMIPSGDQPIELVQGELLQQIARLRDERDAVEQRLAEAVHKAQAARVTYRRIGDVLKMTPSGVRRFAFRRATAA